MAASSGEIHAPAAVGVLSVVAGGRTDPLPDWAAWLVWLGQWLRLQVADEGRRVAVVRLPSRRTGAALAAVGVLFESAALHDDSLDWEALRSLAPGTHVFWREPSGARSVRRAGEVVGTRVMAGQELLVVAVDGGRRGQPVTCSFTRRTTLGYGVTLGAVSAKVDVRLTGAERLLKAAIGTFSPGWIRSPRIDCTIVSERTSFVADLADTSLAIGALGAEPLMDVLSVSDAGGHTYGKTRLLSPRQHGLLDAVGQVTILDGAAAVLRITDTTAASVLAVLDPAEYDEEVELVLMSLMGAASDSFVRVPANGLKAAPQGVEVFVFGLPRSGPAVP